MTKLLPDDALSDLPAGLRKELLDSFGRIVQNFREGRWEPSELNGGKLSEVVYSILQGYVDGSYPAKASKPPNMVDACKSLEKATSAPRSIRIQIPRMLVALYEVRNNRGVGHVGGDVDPNHMDAFALMSMSKWIMAELVRVFHDLGTDEAATAVDALVDREIPLIWDLGDKKRVLSTSLTMKEKTLVLLYGHPEGLSEATLVDWLEHSNASIYRRDILVKAHKARLIEYDKKAKLVRISPLGIAHVDDERLITDQG